MAIDAGNGSIANAAQATTANASITNAVQVSAANAPITDASRTADPDTTDTYIDMLISDRWGSRYAGRVWTDKSVFAYGDDESGNGQITLDTETDGYEGSVSTASDFLHVYSPINLTVQALNASIDQLLEASPHSRLGIAVYSSKAMVLLPLGQYAKADGENSFIALSEERQKDYFTISVTAKEINIKDQSEEIVTKKVTNDTTNIQAGLAAGLGALAGEENTFYTSEATGDLLSRIPVMILLSDGAANTMSVIDGGYNWCNPSEDVTPPTNQTVTSLKTGDDSRLGMWLTIMVLSAVNIVWIMFYLRGRDHRRKYTK